MIESLSNYLAKKLLFINNPDSIDINELEVISYGIECIINTILPIILFIIYAVATNSIIPTLIWLITFLVFRNYIGGYHANSHIQCILFSSIYGLLSLVILNCFTSIPRVILLIIYLLLFIEHHLLNPIIHREENQNATYLKYAKKQATITIVACFVLSLFLSFILPKLSFAILLGLLSAEGLYLIYKLINHRN